MQPPQKRDIDESEGPTESQCDRNDPSETCSVIWPSHPGSPIDMYGGAPVVLSTLLFPTGCLPRAHARHMCRAFWPFHSTLEASGAVSYWH